MIKFRKILNRIALFSGILVGILIPVLGVTAGSFVSVCLGLLFILEEIETFINERKYITKEEFKQECVKKNKEKQLLND